MNCLSISNDVLKKYTINDVNESNYRDFNIIEFRNYEKLESTYVNINALKVIFNEFEYDDWTMSILLKHWLKNNNFNALDYLYIVFNYMYEAIIYYDLISIVIGEGNHRAFKWLIKTFDFHKRKINYYNIFKNGVDVPTINLIHNTYNISRYDMLKMLDNGGINNLSTLKWIHRKFILTDEYVKKLIERKNNYNVKTFKWLTKIFRLEKCDIVHILSYKYDDLSIMKWVYKRFIVEVDDTIYKYFKYAININIQKNDIEILKWISKTIPIGRDYWISKCTNMLYRDISDNLPIIKAIHKIIRFTRNEILVSEKYIGYRHAVRYDELDVLKWLHKEFNIRHSEARLYKNVALKSAILKHNISVIIWLKKTFNITNEEYLNLTRIDTARDETILYLNELFGCKRPLSTLNRDEIIKRSLGQYWK